MIHIAMNSIPGLQYLSNVISEVEERTLVEAIDCQPWLMDLRRRTQHYGYKYDYTKKTLDPSMHLGPLPEWLSVYADKCPFQPEQAIVNEYMPGQGIGRHVDSRVFGPMVASLSLLSPVAMVLAKDGVEQTVQLEPRSLLILEGPARNEWTHEIPQRLIDGDRERSRRISVTFRTVRK